MAVKKASAKKAAKKAGKKTADASRSSMPKGGKDPKGGLPAAGRAFFAEKEGSHLRPGVQGAADTPDKMLRKGSFLRRHFTHPRGPMKDAKGEPTRLALSAHAWGEPVPETMNDAKKLADEGHELLEQYHEAKDGVAEKAKGKAAKKVGAEKKAAVKPATGTPKKAVAKKAVAKKAVAKKAVAKKAVTKQTATKKLAGKLAAKKTSTKKAAAKK